MPIVSPISRINPEPFVASIPGSKSLTNRALVIAAQRMGWTEIRQALRCEDTDYLAACLNMFDGIEVDQGACSYRVRRT
jgi:3-phosphoshikimate 1-carboxyvinyltransferase